MQNTLRRYERGFAHGLMFHRFHPDGVQSGWQGALSPEELERVLSYVGTEHILSPSEWMSRVASNALGPRDTCITFDDGLACQRDYALPVLEEYSLKAFWFVCSAPLQGVPLMSELYSVAAREMGGMENFIETFLKLCPRGLRNMLGTRAFDEYAERTLRMFPFYSLDDVRFRFLRNRFSVSPEFRDAMNETLMRSGIKVRGVAQGCFLTGDDLKTICEGGHHVGLHSHSHPYEMAVLSKEDQAEEYRANSSILSDLLGVKPLAVAHPLNSYSEETLEVLAELGIICGFRSNVTPPSMGVVNRSPLELAREDSANLLRMADEQSRC